MAAALPGFPAVREGCPCAPLHLADRNITLRPAVAIDLPFLRVLYASTRAEELAAVPWPALQKQAFLDSQFDLQHRHYITHFAQASFLVIESDGQPIGRLYLLRQPSAFHVIDIALVPAARGDGTGSRLMAHVQQEAAAAGQDVHLHVDCRNSGARRLYERLGFVAAPTQGAYTSMRWSASVN